MRKREVIISVDPGLDGAIALTIDGQLSTIEDMPTLSVRVGGRDRRRVDVFTIQGLLAALVKQYVEPMDDLYFIVEEVGTRPKEGPVGAFSFGRGFGILEGVAVGMGFPLRYVQPAAWSRALKLKRGKDANRQRAMEIFPTFRAEFARVKDDGRADAALIGHWAHTELRSRGTI